ncbi:MAG: VOC family protein [Chloroflexi bacterium]|nr:MAG: VOC family protein [Chloroflexota bacterium]
MKIKLTSVPVDDQARALDFYTRVLGFVKKTDLPAGEFRWLTVVSPETPDGVELLLEPSEKPETQAYKKFLVSLGIPFTAFATDNVQQEYERLRRLGVKFTMPPTPMGPTVIAVFDDTCGNLIQIYQG